MHPLLAPRQFSVISELFTLHVFHVDKHFKKQIYSCNLRMNIVVLTNQYKTLHARSCTGSKTSSSFYHYVSHYLISMRNLQ
jgi:hypothetical protein